MEAQSAPRCQLDGPKPVSQLNLEVQTSSEGFPKAFQGSSECSWTAFGIPFSVKWSVLGSHWRAFGFPKRLLGRTWRVLDTYWSSKEAHLAARSVLRSSTWRFKASLIIQLGSPKPSQELILEASGAPKYHFGSLGAQLGGLKHLRNRTLTIRATGS